MSLEPKKLTEPAEIEKKRGALVIRPGTLESALNQIVEFYPDFEWKIDDGIIRIYPREKKDSVIDQLLSTEIKWLSFDKRKGSQTVGSEIAEAIEFKNTLKSLGLRDSHYFSDNEINLDESGPTAHFTFQYRSVRKILDQIVKETNSKYWTIARSGDKREFVTIVVGGPEY